MYQNLSCGLKNDKSFTDALLGKSAWMEMNTGACPSAMNEPTGGLRKPLLQLLLMPQCDSYREKTDSATVMSPTIKSCFEPLTLAFLQLLCWIFEPGVTIFGPKDGVISHQHALPTDCMG